MSTQEVRDIVLKGWKAVGFVGEDEYDSIDEVTVWILMGRFMKWKPKFSNPDSMRHYAITLTVRDRTEEELMKTVRRLLSSKSIAPNYFEWCLEDTKAGLPHAHLYIKTPNYIRARDVLRFNDNERVDVKILKGLAINKWLNYIAKEEVPRTEIPIEK